MESERHIAEFIENDGGDDPHSDDILDSIDSSVHNFQVNTNILHMSDLLFDEARYLIHCDTLSNLEALLEDKNIDLAIIVGNLLAGITNLPRGVSKLLDKLFNDVLSTVHRVYVFAGSLDRSQDECDHSEYSMLEFALRGYANVIVVDAWPEDCTNDLSNDLLTLGHIQLSRTLPPPTQFPEPVIINDNAMRIAVYHGEVYSTQEECDAVNHNILSPAKRAHPISWFGQHYDCIILGGRVLSTTMRTANNKWGIYPGSPSPLRIVQAQHDCGIVIWNNAIPTFHPLFKGGEGASVFEPVYRSLNSSDQTVSDLITRYQALLGSEAETLYRDGAQHRPATITRLKGSYVYSYEENGVDIDYESISGIATITGNNASGKTNTIFTLHLALYGCSPRANAESGSRVSMSKHGGLPDFINVSRSEIMVGVLASTEVHLKIPDDPHSYTLTRVWCIKGSKPVSMATLDSHASDGSFVKTVSTKTEIDNWVTRNYMRSSSFLVIPVMLGGLDRDFVGMTGPEKEVFLTDLEGLGWMSNMTTSLKKHLRKCKQDLTEQESKVSALTVSLQEHQARLDALPKVVDDSESSDNVLGVIYTVDEVCRVFSPELLAKTYAAFVDKCKSKPELVSGAKVHTLLDELRLCEANLHISLRTLQSKLNGAPMPAMPTRDKLMEVMLQIDDEIASLEGYRELSEEDRSIIESSSKLDFQPIDGLTRDECMKIIDVNTWHETGGAISPDTPVVQKGDSEGFKALQCLSNLGWINRIEPTQRLPVRAPAGISSSTVAHVLKETVAIKASVTQENPERLQAAQDRAMKSRKYERRIEWRSILEKEDMFNKAKSKAFLLCARYIDEYSGLKEKYSGGIVNRTTYLNLQTTIDRLNAELEVANSKLLQLRGTVHAAVVEIDSITEAAVEYSKNTCIVECYKAVNRILGVFNPEWSIVVRSTTTAGGLSSSGPPEWYLSTAGNVGVPIWRASRAQITLISIAFRIYFFERLTRGKESCKSSGPLILDEVFAPLDEYNRSISSRLLDHLTTRFKSILIVGHDRLPSSLATKTSECRLGQAIVV